MRRIIHLSDLHYGRTDPDLETPLLDTIRDLGPDLVIVSGDFTQRARVAQFEKARSFLDRIDAPVLSVPGNHDTPLDNLFLRFLKPFSRYRRAIDRNLEPTWEDEEMTVVGVNTVNQFSWQRGRVSSHTVKRVCNAFDKARGKLRVAVLHHPLEHGPEVDKKLMKGAGRAVEALAECGADVVLSGHLHTAHAKPFTAAPGLLFVQAGTGLSTRRRGGEDNTFNVLEADADKTVTITTWSAERWANGAPAFTPEESADYVHEGDSWTRRGPRRQMAAKGS